MDQPVRRIGVFTSGGDAPGMNAAIRSVVRTCLHMGIECIGVRRGYHGLINGDFVPLTFESVSGLSRRGGRRRPPPANCWVWTRWWASAATVPSADCSAWRSRG